MKAAVGGTFDHLHKGHERLLSETASLGLPMVVGLTTQVLLGGKKYKEYLEDYETRKSNVEQYLNRLQASYEVLLGI